MDEKIIPVHTESIDSNESLESLETCIICLDDVDDNTIYFPCKYSTCSCKYTIHLMCIKENNIHECVICKSAIIYPVQNDLIQIDTFENNIVDVDVGLDVNVDIDLDTNTYRHEARQEECKCINKNIYICAFSLLFAVLFTILVWYMSISVPE